MDTLIQLFGDAEFKVGVVVGASFMAAVAIGAIWLADPESRQIGK